MRIFVEVVRRGGIGSGALGLEMPKSTVSHRLKQLEARLGVQLLHRNTRKVSLTSEGECYFEKAADVVSLAEDADRAIQSGASAPRGVLRIACFQLFADIILAPLVAEFSKQYQDVEVRIRVTEQFEDVIGEGIDLAIRAGQLQDSELLSRKLGNLEIWLCAAPEFMAAQTKLRHPTGLASLPSVAYGRTWTEQPWELRCGSEQCAVTPHGRLLTTSIFMVVEMTCAGAGVAALPRILAEELVDAGKLVRVLPEWEVPEGARPALYALHANRSHMSSSLKFFWSFLLERVSQTTLNRRNR